MDYEHEQTGQGAPREEAVEIPLDRIAPDILRRMIEEFVTREWSELGDAGHSLDGKVDQVLRQLRSGQAKIVYDTMSETWNIVPCR